MTDLSQIKNNLRKNARIKRKAFVANRAGAWWEVCRNQLDSYVKAGMMVASYRPVGSEADPLSAERRAVQLGAHVCYPRIDFDGLMRFYAPGRANAWIKGPYGIEEPASNSRETRPAIVFLPLLAFDRSGTRLGQGGGHYDRTLALLDAQSASENDRPLKIGIAWSVQEMDTLPRDTWDISLDFVLTEREWIKVGK
jgi:5-formyltetrahydrofolate cyclo-ligase